MKRKLFNSLTDIKGFFKEMLYDFFRIFKVKKLESSSSGIVA